MINKETLSERPTGRQHPREVLRLGITDAILNGEKALFDVLPGLGKSRTAAVAAKTEIPVSVFTNLEENYGQFEDWCREFGVHFETFPTTTEDCPTLGGDYLDDQDAKAAQEAYFRKGWPVKAVHDEYDLPCQRDGTCSYLDKVRGLDFDGPGLFAGYYNQAYAKSYVDGRVVVIDEDAFDEYYDVIQYPAKEAQKFIDTLDDFPLDELRRLDGKERENVLKQLEQSGLEPEDHTDSVGDFHAKAPFIAYAIYGADELDNGLKYIELPSNRSAVFRRLYETEEDGVPTMWLFDPPNLSGAEAIIGLDATPCLSKWVQILGEDFNHYRLFDDDQRSQYLREQGYEFIQLNSHAWPSQGGNLSIPKCEAYLREVYREHEERPDLITGKDIRDELEDRGLNHLWDEDLYYDNLRGKNDIKNSELLVVLGAPSRGDSYYQHLTALFGESAERVEDTQGTNLSFGNPVANDILDSHRRGDVFQAIMRAGRKEETKATVYIATGLVPDWLETKKVGKRLPSGSFDACPRHNLRSDGEKEVIKALKGANGISASELVDQVSLGEEMVKNHRQSLQEQGLIDKEGERRWARYSDKGLEALNIAGSVDLSLSGTMPSKVSMRGRYPIESRPEPAIPRRDPLELPPEKRYPDWMRDTMRRARQRKFDEQMKQAWRDES